MTKSHRVRGTWYLAALLPLVVGGGIAAHGCISLFGAIEDMPRVVVPGSGELALEAGDHIVYGESNSVWNGATYMTSSLELRCGMQGSDGQPIELATPTSQTSYQVGAFAGRSMFALSIPRAGTYRLVCEGSGGPATLAVGTGIGGTIVRAVVGGFGGFGGFAAAIAVLVVVRIQRRRARDAQRGAVPAAPAP